MLKRLWAEHRNACLLSLALLVVGVLVNPWLLLAAVLPIGWVLLKAEDQPLTITEEAGTMNESSSESNDEYSKQQIQSSNEGINQNISDNYFNLGMNFMDKEDFEKAINKFSKVIEIEPTSYVAYYNRGNAKRELYKYQEAINDYTKAIQINPEYFRAYCNRGNLKDILEDHHGAVDDFTKALKISPGDSASYLNRARAYLKLRQYEIAVYDYNKVLDEDLDYQLAYWDYVSAYVDRGKARLQNLGDSKIAIDDFNKAIEIDPNCLHAYLHRSRSYREQEKYEEAISDLNKSLELYTEFGDLERDPDLPTNSDIYWERGILKDSKGAWEEAIEDFELALQLNPNNPYILNSLGVAKMHQGDYEGAIKCYSKALDIKPKDALAYRNRGIAKSNSEDNQGAISDFTKAIGLDPDDSRAYESRGDTKMDLDDYQGAIDDYDKAIELDPKEALAYRNRGIAKRESGDSNGALKDFEKARELGDVYAIELLQLGSLTKDELSKEINKKRLYLFELNVSTILKSISLVVVPCSDLAFYDTLSLYINFIEKPINDSPITTTTAQDIPQASMATLRVLLNLLDDTNPDTWEHEQGSDDENSKQHLEMCRFYAETYLDPKLAKDWVENERLVDYDENDPDPYAADIWCLPPPSSIPENLVGKFPPHDEWETHYSNKKALLNDVDWELVARTVAAAWQDSIDPDEVAKCRIFSWK